MVFGETFLMCCLVVPVVSLMVAVEHLLGRKWVMVFVFLCCSLIGSSVRKLVGVRLMKT